MTDRLRSSVALSIRSFGFFLRFFDMLFLVDSAKSPQAAGRLIVTPGVRPAGAALGDQKRVETPAAAIAAGADHIVVGRPIWQSADPRAAAQAILAELG